LTGCSLCKFFSEPYNSVKKQIFEAKINEGYSLRQLKILLEGMGVSTSKDTIRRHLSSCLKVETKKQTTIKSIKDFFNPPTIPKQSECQHRKEIRRFDMPSERVRVFCASCGAYLYDFDPDEDRSKFNDSRLYHKLMREREMARRNNERVPNV